jgi:hypothetical protein
MKGDFRAGTIDWRRVVCPTCATECGGTFAMISIHLLFVSCSFHITSIDSCQRIAVLVSRTRQASLGRLRVAQLFGYGKSNLRALR